MKLTVWLPCFMLLAMSVPALADAAPNPWGEIKTPSGGPARAVGDYSAGCLKGAKALPLQGEGFQVMHPSRLRYFGHPQLVDFVRMLGRAVHAGGLGMILLGDLSQPRGGRATGGHASHQSGLDVDIWFWHPKQAERRRLSPTETESLSARTIVDGKNSSIKAAWKSWAAEVLRLTANDARVERVFVHPIIKRELCALPGDDRAWLRKLRPWHGHDDHFHVRLACPKDSPNCTPQEAIGPGDGCDELDFWFSEAARSDREKARKTYEDKVITSRKWPAQCDALLEPDKAAP
jgi:penicillin-insensitive murein endopeptidase